MQTQPTPFEAHVRRQGGANDQAATAVAVIDMQGEINGFAEERLNEAYAAATRQRPTAVVLNFSQVDYINSTGIALIVGLLAQARKAHLPIITFGLSDHYQEIFRITRLSDFMNIYPDEGAALTAVTAGQAR